MLQFLRNILLGFGSAPVEGLSLTKDTPRDMVLINRALLLALGVGLVFIILRYPRGPLETFAIACMWAGSCLISGAAVGFLFAIPRVVQGHVEGKGVAGDAASKAVGVAVPAGLTELEVGSYRQEVNTNLVEISDWLTKIIVGLGLVNLKSIPEVLHRTASTLARGLGATNQCQQGIVACDNYAFATALIVAFGLLGFFMGYLYTRLFLAGAFSRADQSGNTLLARSARVIQQEKTDSVGKNGSTNGTGEITEWQVRAAERISELPEAQDLVSTVAALRKLGSEYDAVRASLASGDARTRRMGSIVVSMRGLALAGRSQIAHFADSASPGNRLAAVVMLQMKPDPTYFRWLLERINLEKPFIAYQAIQALTRAVDTADQRNRDTLRQLLMEWVKTEKARDMLGEQTDRSRMLRDLLARLDISV